MNNLDLNLSLKKDGNPYGNQVDLVNNPLNIFKMEETHNHQDAINIEDQAL